MSIRSWSNIFLLIGLVSFSFSGAGNAAAQTYTPGQTIKQDFNRLAKPFLENHCLDCHGANDPEGDLSLVDLGPIDEVNAGTWKSIWAQVTLKEMPPTEEEQPEVIRRLQFSDWIVGYPRGSNWRPRRRRHGSGDLPLKNTSLA